MVAYIRVHERQMSTYDFSGRLVLVISHSQTRGIVLHYFTIYKLESVLDSPNNRLFLVYSWVYRMYSTKHAAINIHGRIQRKPTKKIMIRTDRTRAFPDKLCFYRLLVQDAMWRVNRYTVYHMFRWSGLNLVVFLDLIFGSFFLN